MTYRFIKRHRHLAIIILFSIILRYFCISNGGQYFWLDEVRYLNGHYFLSAISDADYSDAINRITSTYAHTGFTIFASFAELMRFCFVKLFNDGYVSAYMLTESMLGIKISAFVLSLSNGISLAFIYGIVLKTKGSIKQALIAAGLMSLSSSLLCYSRHLLPYDSSLMLSLAAAYIGINNNNIKMSSTCTGILLSLSFLTYNGYSAIIICIVLIHLFWNNFNITTKAKRSLYLFVGGVIPIQVI